MLFRSLCIRERGGTTGKGAGVINQMNEKGPSVGQCPYLLRHFQRNSRCLTALLVLSNKFTGISRHAEGANHAGSQGYASPVTELQPGRGAPKSIRRWKPSPETYPASDGVAQWLERLPCKQWDTDENL